MTSLVYNFLLILCAPGIFLYYLWRILVTRKSNEAWRDNLGALPRLADRETGRKLIWIHAASVGEVVASLPIQNEIRRLLPDAVILVTTVTQTGNAVARKSARAANAIGYLPLDYPVFVNRALNRVQPDIVVTVDTEIWPNFLAAARRRGMPTVLVNGRISDQSFRRGLRWRWLMSWAVSNITFCCMQTQADAERIRSLGASPQSIHVFGSTKFDQEGGELLENAVRALRLDLRLPNGVPVFVAGSTNRGEEEPVLTAFQEIRVGRSDLRLIIAPRQIERADEVQALAEARGLKCARRSLGAHSPKGYDVLILDTFGELASAYAVGEIAFVGGTLVPKGGHSLFQPVLQGKPVLFGPHTFKTRDMASMVVSAGVGFQVKDAGELAERGKTLLADAEHRAKISAACHKIVSENMGAATRCAKLIGGLLGVQMRA